MKDRNSGFWEVSKLSKSIILGNNFICVEELNYMKDYMKFRREHKGRVSPPPFALISLNMRYLLEKNDDNTGANLVC